MFIMYQSWRWYGPSDPVTLDYARQSGATDIVTALHECYDGQVWKLEDIYARQKEIQQAGLVWSVVESIPVPTEIKLFGAGATAHVAAFKSTMKNLAEAGLEVICYNFMPVVDWTRTDLRFSAPNGGLALRFDPIDFATYDMFILNRPNADSSYSTDVISLAEVRFTELSVQDIKVLEQNIIAGLPGSEGSHTREGISKCIAKFYGFSNTDLRRNLISFLGEIIPLADDLGLRMGLHPDDPPFSLFGLPRVLSTAKDYRTIFEAFPSLANGITFCTGSLGASEDNDLLSIIKEFSPRIQFAHLRNVQREKGGGFYEADHLEGSTNMIEIVKLLIEEESRRRDEGRIDWQFPMRPDHGHLLLDDILKETNAGYSAIGRLKGLAELRGVIKTFEHVFEA
jgi:mannonate dehydratase